MSDNNKYQTVKLSAISDLPEYDVWKGKTPALISSALAFAEFANNMFIETSLSADNSDELSSRRVSLKSIFDLISSYVENRVDEYVLLKNEYRPIVTDKPLSVCGSNGIILSSNTDGSAVSVINNANYNNINNVVECVATSAIWN